MKNEGLRDDEFEGDDLGPLADSVELRREHADPPVEVGTQRRHPNQGNAVGLNDLNEATTGDRKVGDGELLKKQARQRLGGLAARLRQDNPGHRLLGLLGLCSSLVEKELEMIGRE